jgi:hypothetical protein
LRGKEAEPPNDGGDKAMEEEVNITVDEGPGEYVAPAMIYEYTAKKSTVDTPDVKVYTYVMSRDVAGASLSSASERRLVPTAVGSLQTAEAPRQKALPTKRRDRVNDAGKITPLPPDKYASVALHAVARAPQRSLAIHTVSYSLPLEIQNPYTAMSGPVLLRLPHAYAPAPAASG